MRGDLSVGNCHTGLLLLVLGGTVMTAEAGPLVTHPLASDSSGKEGEPPVAATHGPIAPGLPTTFPDAGGSAPSSPPTLNDFGYPNSSPSAASGAGVSDQVRQSLPTMRRLRPDLAWLAPEKTDRRLGSPRPIVGPGMSIPEPASFLLLVTGLVGLLARRRLLRNCGKPS